MSLNGEPYDVIGIVRDSPSLRRFGFDSDVYVPLQIDPSTADEANYLTVVARLAPSVTLAAAKDRLRSFADENRTKYPNTIGKRGSFSVERLR
jgi:hypothetical protein